MRGILLGTAALLAAMAIAGAASADQTVYDKRVKISVGGFFAGAGGYLDTSGSGVGEDAEVGAYAGAHVRGMTILDNGIEVGLTANWAALNDCSFAGFPSSNSALCSQNDVSRVYADFTTGLGKVQIGQPRGASSQLMIRTPSVLASASAADSPLDPLAISNVNSVLDDSGRGAKLIYFTPRLFGIQAGFSYVWDTSRSGPLVTLVPDPVHPNSGGRTAFAAAVNFERDISDIVFRGAAAYYTDNRVGGAADPAGYNLGIQVGFGGFTLGGNYTRGDNMDHRTTYVHQSETDIWSAGLTWGTGPWLLGLNYADGRDALAGVNGDFTSVVGGLSYEMRPGIKFGFGYQHDDADPGVGIDAKGDAVFMETGLKF